MPAAATLGECSVTRDDDYFAWTQNMAKLLQERRADLLDWDELAEEIERVAGSDRRELTSRLEVLVAHLLKWRHQPELRGTSWMRTILEQRASLAHTLSDSPSLRRLASAKWHVVHHRARRSAALQTGLPLQAFPATPPFSLEQVLDDDYLPE